jgi:putative NADPH-quinone reductase
VAQIEFSLLRTKAEFETGTPSEPIARCQQDLLWAEHIVFVFPLWLGTLPAQLKGFLEQVFRPSFAFGQNSTTGQWAKLLSGKSARIVVTMGMPAFFFRWYYGAHGLRAFERNILSFAGIGPIRETLIGMVERGPETAKAALEKLRGLGAAGA